MHTRRTIVTALFVLAASLGARAGWAQEIVTTGPPPELRTNMQAFIKALNANDAKQWEEMAKTVFTADYFKNETPVERKKTLDKLRAAFGDVTIDHVERQGGPDAPLQVFVKGTVASGIIWVDLDDASRFMSIKPEVTKKDADRSH